jgi:hypothetical protein
LVTFCHHRWCVKDLCLLITSIRSLSSFGLSM